MAAQLFRSKVFRNNVFRRPVSRKPALAALLVGASCLASASAVSAQPNDAEPATRRANAEVLRSLPFGDRVDFDEAQRGFIAALPGAIMSADGQRTIWSMQPYAFETGEPPATVNPSL
ncbi:MAG: fold metallo-hydrolase, partial [Gammaproteobacteria bacterium]|nr:fold metallo-hydrolase [Gammaproteobacteria bacterium]